MPGLRLLWIVKWSRVVPIPRRSISPWGEDVRVCASVVHSSLVLFYCTIGDVRQHGSETGGMSHQVEQRVRGHLEEQHAIAARVWISSSN